MIILNIDYQRCREIVLLLKEYFQNQNNLATIEYPVNITYGTNEYICGAGRCYCVLSLNYMRDYEESQNAYIEDLRRENRSKGSFRFLTDVSLY